MKIKLLPILYDDDNKECKEGDAILIATKKNQELTPAILQTINTMSLTFVYDSPIMGYKKDHITISDVIKLQKSNTIKRNY